MARTTTMRSIVVVALVLVVALVWWTTRNEREVHLATQTTTASKAETPMALEVSPSQDRDLAPYSGLL